MLIGKLNTGRIVLVLKHDQPVMFSPYKHTLINDNIHAPPGRYKPYWVRSTTVAKLIDMGDEK